MSFFYGKSDFQFKKIVLIVTYLERRSSMADYSLLYGRELLKEEIKEDYLLEHSSMSPGFKQIKGKYFCMRCGTKCILKTRYPCTCQNQCLYCRECIALGKVRECSHFYHLSEPNHFKSLSSPCLKWQGTLSPQQKQASDEIKESMRKCSERIVWAVTGAGKTEMLFEGLEEALMKGKRICIASPRIDVCLELAPRFQTAFPDVSLALLYGGVEEEYRYTQLVVATTHQLYRFKEAFDVIVIDEIDAFPYYLNDALYFASNKAKKRKSATIYLTATPDRKMRNKIKRGRIEASLLPARYHKHALPVPKGVYHSRSILDKKISNSHPVMKHIQKLITLKKRFILFIPTISMMEEVYQMLKKFFQKSRFERVHSQDPERKNKVMKMRQGEFDFLLTTTILERGVTFPNIDVIVIGSDHQVYTEAALVQIAGRAGRSADYPTGEVTYYHQGWTRSMKGAVKQIKRMNQLAMKKGYIK